MPFPTPFEIYDASTASYGKKVSSTYHRYACGTFLPNSLYLHRLFQKAYGRSLYCVAAHKLILNVSKIRLRLICARASYLRRLFQKAYGKVITECGF